jgi:multidrug efflux pump subunit AcrA (membrane-fusion protein)
MFVQVGFQTGSAESSDQELVVKAEALQRLGERTVVFLPKDDEPGAFQVRDVQVGAETNGYTRILSGLQLGEKVVTKGSFTLKTQLMKGELGDHDH